MSQTNGPQRPPRPGPPTARTGRWTGPGRTLRRALGADRNPLCRPLDRARSAVVLLALVLGAGAAAAAWSVAGAVLHAELAVLAREQGHRHLVAAVALGPASTAADPATARARARWDYPGHRAHTGVVSVPRGTRRGGSVALWVDDAGRPSSMPGSTGGAAADAAVAGGTALAAEAVLLSLGTRLALGLVEHRAARAWAEEWARVEPDWSGRAGRRHRGTA